MNAQRLFIAALLGFLLALLLGGCGTVRPEAIGDGWPYAGWEDGP